MRRRVLERFGDDGRSGGWLTGKNAIKDYF
jgi:hypothetical protein